MMVKRGTLYVFGWKSENPRCSVQFTNQEAGGKLADPLDRKSRASVSLCKLSRVFCCTLWPHDSSNAARLLKQPSGISYISYV
jgi:hypothetical protein